MTGRIPKVVVIGATYVDITIRCDQIPSPGQSVIGSGFSCSATGPGLHQSVQSTLCGCEVYLISKIGGGPFGQTIINALEEHNIKTDFIFTAEAKNTGTIVTLVNAEGENTSITFDGANSALTPLEINTTEQIITDADVCLINGQLPPEAIKQAIRLSNVQGTKVILDPVRPMETLKLEDKAFPPEYFSADILIPNFYEAADITEHSDANTRTVKLIGSDLVARGVKAAVITMGKRGCMIVDRNGADHIPAFNIELVDQTCTGDAFAGALAASCAVGDKLTDAVKFASAAGALACTKFGSVESLPTKAEIIELLQKADIG